MLISFFSFTHIGAYPERTLMLVLILLEGNWLVKSDHDARSDGRADHHLLTGVMAALISGKEKIDQRKTMQN